MRAARRPGSAAPLPPSNCPRRRRRTWQEAREEARASERRDVTMQIEAADRDPVGRGGGSQKRAEGRRRGPRALRGGPSQRVQGFRGLRLHGLQPALRGATGGQQGSAGSFPPDGRALPEVGHLVVFHPEREHGLSPFLRRSGLEKPQAVQRKYPLLLLPILPSDGQESRACVNWRTNMSDR